MQVVLKYISILLEMVRFKIQTLFMFLKLNLIQKSIFRLGYYLIHQNIVNFFVI